MSVCLFAGFNNKNIADFPFCFQIYLFHVQKAFWEMPHCNRPPMQQILLGSFGFDI